MSASPTRRPAGGDRGALGPLVLVRLVPGPSASGGGPGHWPADRGSPLVAPPAPSPRWRSTTSSASLGREMTTRRDPATRATIVPAPGHEPDRSVPLLPPSHRRHALAGSRRGGRASADRARPRAGASSIFTAHFGNWELLAAAHGLTGVPLSIVIRPLDHPLLDDLAAASGAAAGPSSSSSARRCGRSCRPCSVGGWSASSSIRTRPAPRGVRPVLRGRPRPPRRGWRCWPSGRAPRWCRSSCAASRRPALHGRERPCRPPADGTSPTYTRCSTGSIEAAIRRAPEQWLWMHARWRTRPPRGGARDRGCLGRAWTSRAACVLLAGPWSGGRRTSVAGLVAPYLKGAEPGPSGTVAASAYAEPPRPSAGPTPQPSVSVTLLPVLGGPRGRAGRGQGRAPRSLDAYVQAVGRIEMRGSTTSGHCSRRAPGSWFAPS